MIYSPMTRKALQIAYKAHEKQTDKSGLPYIFHPYHVAEQMEDELTACIAILHDVLEDTNITKEELDAVFPAAVMEPLLLLTHDPSVPYIEYIRKIKQNPIARKVKLADIAHNMDESRLSGVEISEKQLQHWRRKYREALEILNQSE